MQPTRSRRRGQPIDFINNAASKTAVTGETVQFYYNNAGTLTADAGQAAGTLVVCKLKYNNILDALGDSTGLFGDKSLSFTSTAFTTEVNVGQNVMEALDDLTTIEKLAYVALNVVPFVLSSNGKYFVDYEKGLLFGLKASTQTTLTAGAYLVPTPLSSSGGGAGSGGAGPVAGQHSGALPQGLTTYFSFSGVQTDVIPLYQAIGSVTIGTFHVASTTGNGVGHTDTYTIVKNGVDTTMTLAVTNASSGSTTTNPVSLSAGDTVAIKVVSDAATAAANVLASFNIA